MGVLMEIFKIWEGFDRVGIEKLVHVPRTGI